MKVLSWMHSKLQGKVKIQSKESSAFPSNNDHHKKPAELPEEISPSLPLGLLAIGTFGNNELRVKADVVVDDDPSPTEETKDCSLEDDAKLEEELRELILQQKSQLGGEEIEVLPLEKILSCSTSSEVDGRDDFDNETEERDEDVKVKIGLVTGEWKGDVEKSNIGKSVVKRSVSFLVKKMFFCGSGFAAPLPPSPPPNFTDHTPQDARMKKILREMLHKKIYPKNSSQMASLKRFIKEREMRNEDKENNYDNCYVNSGSKSIQNVS